MQHSHGGLQQEGKKQEKGTQTEANKKKKKIIEKEKKTFIRSFFLSLCSSQRHYLPVALFNKYLYTYERLYSKI